MKSWTRTLNLDDAHTLLALISRPAVAYTDWTRACHEALPGLSTARRRELIRILRDDFLEWKDGLVQPSLFLQLYGAASAMGQIDLMAVQWALTHPLTLVATEELVAPALETTTHDVPLADLDALVAEHLETDSAESQRKTRTTLLGAMEGIGTLETRGTGQHRSLSARRGAPHPLAFAYLVRRDLAERGIDGMMATEAVESSLGARLTLCGPDHAHACIDWSLETGVLIRVDDEIRAPESQP